MIDLLFSHCASFLRSYIVYLHFVGLEALNHEHHNLFKSATNHDTVYARNRKSYYTEPQSSIQQIMNHSIMNTILHDRFVLEESLKTIASNGKLKNFPGSGWPRNTPVKEFRDVEMRSLQVGSSFFRFLRKVFSLSIQTGGIKTLSHTYRTRRSLPLPVAIFSCIRNRF